MVVAFAESSLVEDSRKHYLHTQLDSEVSFPSSRTASIFLLQVHLFQGSPLKLANLKRVKAASASMVFVVADFTDLDARHQDHSNILITMTLGQYYPEVPYRLMVVEVEQLNLAANAGLDMFDVYAIDELKVALMAASLRSPGVSTLLINLALPPIPDPKGYDNPVSPWLKDYIAASELAVHGFRPALKYRGKSFSQMAVLLGGSDITLLAIQVKGSIRMNPGEFESIQAESILYVICRSETELDPFSLDDTADVPSWVPLFTANRAKQGGYHNIYAKLEVQSQGKVQSVSAFGTGKKGAGASPKKPRRRPSLDSNMPPSPRLKLQERAPPRPPRSNSSGSNNNSAFSSTNNSPKSSPSGSFSSDNSTNDNANNDSSSSSSVRIRRFSLKALVSSGLENERLKQNKGQSLGRIPLPFVTQNMAPTLSPRSATSNKVWVSSVGGSVDSSRSHGGDVDDDARAHSQELEPPPDLLFKGGHVVLLLIYDRGRDDKGALLISQAEFVIGNLRSTSDTPVVIVGPPHGEAINKVECLDPTSFPLQNM